MTNFGQLPRSFDNLPIGEVYTPNTPNGDLTALQGGLRTQDSLGLWSAPGMVEDIEQAGYIALTSPPTQTNAGSDTVLTFSSQVNRVIIQNNTTVSVNYAFDVAATAGSLVLAPGTFLAYPKKCTALHLFTAAAQNVNGTTAGNIVVLGAM